MLKGKHLIIEGEEADRNILGNLKLCYKFLDECPQVVEMHKISVPHVQQHLKFPDPEWGISGFVIIAESHISIHTYPERRFIALDIFSCKDFDVQKAIEFTVKKFKIKKYQDKVFNRGLEYPCSINKASVIVNNERQKFVSPLANSKYS